MTYFYPLGRPHSTRRHLSFYQSISLSTTQTIIQWVKLRFWHSGQPAGSLLHSRFQSLRDDTKNGCVADQPAGSLNSGRRIGYPFEGREAKRRPEIRLPFAGYISISHFHTAFGTICEGSRILESGKKVILWNLESSGLFCSWSLEYNSRSSESH